MPAETNFLRLHSIIQTAMGWNNSHLFSFDFPEKHLQIVDERTNDAYEEYKMMVKRVWLFWDVPLKEYEKRILETKILRARSARLAKYIENQGKIDYIYDFNDRWQHEIELEKITCDLDMPHPILIRARGKCPPEECGGIEGYVNFMRAFKDTHHPEHKETLAWGRSQGYGTPDENKINAKFSRFRSFRMPRLIKE
jgi:phage pi2 protein 07